MSLYEGRDIEPARASQTPGTQQRVEYQLPTTQAAEVLGISERQVRRVLAAYRREGAASLVHGNRGRQPRNSVNEDIATAVVILASGKYAGFNHSHFTEVLAEREGIHLSRQTVSRLLNCHGLPSARRHRPPKHRVRRERMPQEGMLLQIDGSHHPWLEERGPRFALLLAVDDATGTVAGAVFQPEEDTRGYFLLMEGIIHRYGIPLAIYSDRHGVFKFSGKPRHITQPVGPTQFTRAMQELGIEQVFARSPQAKGRVERMAGTFQDRLVSELRLAGATTINQANAVLREFLPQFNKQFRVPAQQPEVAYRPLDSSIFLERVLCFKHTRQVARDNTVKFQWRTLQLLPSEDRPSYAGAKVEVLEQTGSVFPGRPWLVDSVFSQSVSDCASRSLKGGPFLLLPPTRSGLATRPRDGKFEAIGQLPAVPVAYCAAVGAVGGNGQHDGHVTIGGGPDLYPPLGVVATDQSPRRGYLSPSYRKGVVPQGLVAEAFQILAEMQFKGECILSIVGSRLTVDAGRQRRLNRSRNRCGGNTGSSLLVLRVISEGHLHLDGLARVCGNQCVAAGRCIRNVRVGGPVIGDPLVGIGDVGQPVGVPDSGRICR